ncbi:MAG: Arabinose efflux permease, partial [Capsulimonas sp.]|nr:Arabinose efflux permease [Capsulimonas sp.]
VAAVTVRIGGAWLWLHFHNYQLPFWIGVAIAGVSLIAMHWLPTGPPPAKHMSDAEVEMEAVEEKLGRV